MTNAPGMDPLARFPTIAERDEGAELQPTLDPNINGVLAEPIDEWLCEMLPSSYPTAMRVLLGCRIDVRNFIEAARAWDSGADRRLALDDYSMVLRYLIAADVNANAYGGIDLLNGFIHVHDGWGVREWSEALRALDSLLRAAGSAWEVSFERRGLYRRVDATVEQAHEEAVASAEAVQRSSAARHLRTAWQEAYGVSPDPTKAYFEAVRAVEAAAAPVVAPKNQAPTLGQLLADMRVQNWELTLVDKQAKLWPATTFIGLLDQLWKGQRSRHGGGTTSRDQTQQEAEAAVHLTALAVQWFTTGAVRKATP